MFQLDPETEDRSLPLLFVSSPDSQCILDSRLFIRCKVEGDETPKSSMMPIFNSGESLSVYQLGPKLSHAEIVLLGGLRLGRHLHRTEARLPGSPKP